MTPTPESGRGSAGLPAPFGIDLGSCLVSLLEPHRGKEVEMHRWYERDHFYAGCMIGPWFFSGRRYVATRAHKDLRYPEQTPVIDDITVGSYLALYWILADHYKEALDFAVPQVNWLNEVGRMYPDRDQAHAGFYDLRFSAFRDPDGVPAELALDHPYAGVALTLVDRGEDVPQERVDTWLEQEHLPCALADSPAGMCLGFAPYPLPDDAPSYVKRPPGLDRRSLQIWFLEEDPLACWDDVIAGLGEAVAGAGLGGVSYAAGFVPTIPGSDRYCDELW